MPPSQMCSSVSSTRPKNADAAVRVSFCSAGARSPARQSNSNRRIGETSARRAARRSACRSRAQCRSPRDRARRARPRPCPRGRAFSESRAIRASRFLRMRSGSSPNSRAISRSTSVNAGAAVARLLREIRAAPHRLARGRQKHRERPAALLAEQMQRVHVDLVDVGPLLAVDLDVDEQLVHHARPSPRPRSSRAPSRGTSGRPRSRPRAGSACCCRLRLGRAPPVPTPPVDRIVLVLQQIRRGLAARRLVCAGVRCWHGGTVARMERQRNPGLTSGVVTERSRIALRSHAGYEERRSKCASTRGTSVSTASAASVHSAKQQEIIAARPVAAEVRTPRECENVQLNGITSTGPRNSVSRIGKQLRMRRVGRTLGVVISAASAKKPGSGSALAMPTHFWSSATRAAKNRHA